MKEDFEILVLTSKEVLLTLFDLTTPFYEASRIYRRSIRKYLEQRSVDRSEFLSKIRYLKSKGYIRIFVEGKEGYAELTNNGKNRAQTLLLGDLEIKRPQKWDDRWRVVLFDIPEKKHYARDIFREHLKRLRFIQIQKSVYVFPFECTKEITFLTDYLNISPFVTIMISDIIQGEDRIIRGFMDLELLNNKDLKR